LSQVWKDLLFAHWQVPAPAIQTLLPAGLHVECFEGAAWLGIVPFELVIRHRCAPPLPSAARFPEINVRTYVTDGRRSGVWFFSLDAASRIAVWAARRFFELPYFMAQMKIERDPRGVIYHSSRRPGKAQFQGSYGPIDPPRTAVAGTLDHFLTERYCLYSANRAGELFRADVHHAPWQLSGAWAKIQQNSMTEPIGIPLSGEPVLHYAQATQVVSWPLRRVAAAEPAAIPSPAPAIG
jgi:uncharacterized protein YqjF (DUF2071 family)